MGNTNFHTIIQMPNIVNSIVKQATGREAVQNIDMDFVTVAQQRKTEETTTDYAGMASFMNNNELPLKVLAKINPVQDLHGYDYPWPAGGGKNKLPNENGTYKETTENNIYIIESAMTLPAGTYYIKYFADKSTGLPYAGFYLSINGGTASRVGSNHAVQEAVESFVLSEQSNITLRLYSATSGFDGAKYRFMLTVEDPTNMPFAPYSNICPITGWTGVNIYHYGTDASDPEIIPVSWETEAGTVYGGTINVTTGVLTVDRAMVDLGTLTWSSWEQGGSWIFSASISDKLPTRTDPCICTNYVYNAKVNSWSDLLNGQVTGQIGGTNIYIRDTAYSDNTAFKTAMSGVQLVYELATPITVQLTPTEIDSLIGENNLYADTGDISVSYTTYYPII